MRRLYVLLPNEDCCRFLVDELHATGIRPSHLHVLAGLTHELKDLPAATIWQRTELAHGIEWGIGLGGVAGFLGGLLVIAFPPAGIELGGGALLAGTAAGAGFGAIVTSLLGSQEHNHKLNNFQHAVARGQVLLLADVPRQREAEIRSMIRKHHPEAVIESVKGDSLRPRAIETSTS